LRSLLMPSSRRTAMAVPVGTVMLRTGGAAGAGGGVYTGAAEE